MTEGPRITADDLGLPDVPGSTVSLNLRKVRAKAERDAIVDALAVTGQNLSRTSEILGITRPTLYTLLKKHDLHSDD